MCESFLGFAICMLHILLKFALKSLYILSFPDQWQHTLSLLQAHWDQVIFTTNTWIFFCTCFLSTCTLPVFTWRVCCLNLESLSNECSNVWLKNFEYVLHSDLVDHNWMASIFLTCVTNDASLCSPCRDMATYTYNVLVLVSMFFLCCHFLHFSLINMMLFWKRRVSIYCYFKRKFYSPSE